MLLVLSRFSVPISPDPDLSNNYAEVSVTVHQAPTVVSLERLGYHTGPTRLVGVCARCEWNSAARPQWGQLTLDPS